jgi:WD repeat-containing protein 19
VLGKHPRRITCGAWSTTGKLALGSEDRTMTISDREGNTEDQREMKHPPTEMCFAAQKGAGDGSGGETHLSINMDASLLLYNLTDPDNPLELAFQAKYGRIVTHNWFDDGHIMLGFDQGFLVVISTMLEEIGEELYSARFHHQKLTDVSYSPNLKLAACAGDSGVKILDCSRGFDDIKPEDLSLSGERCSSVGWSPDGQILTVATTSGSVLAFLARMDQVHASYKSQVAYLSSLREVSVVDPRTKMQPLKVTVSLEPQFIALGGMHCAAGAQSRVHYYRCMPQDCSEVDEPIEYV